MVRLESKINFTVSLINLLWNHMTVMGEWTKRYFAVQAQLNKLIWQFRLKVSSTHLTVLAQNWPTYLTIRTQSWANTFDSSGAELTCIFGSSGTELIYVTDNSGTESTYMFDSSGTVD